MRISSLILLTFGLVFGSVVHAGGDVAAGKAKSATCTACHGADGNSVNPVWPKLAGQHVAYLEKQIKDFRDGKRKDPMMSAMAASLSDADISNLAAYFAAQKQK
ncbi:MAG: cytochrome c [Gammaproteobacteria bacterium]